MKNTKDVKRQHGITLISLVITVIILLILAAVAINLAVDSNGLFAKTGKAANSWNSSVSGEEQTLQDILMLADEITGDKIPISQFYQNGGSIEVKFVDKNNQITQNPLAPVLGTGMTPIKWNGSAWVDTTEVDTAWYDYSQSKWANARTDDGSMWVWIPRYAYEITYTLAPFTTYTASNTGTATAEEFAGFVNEELHEIFDLNSGIYCPAYPVADEAIAKATGSTQIMLYEENEDGSYTFNYYNADTATLSSTKTTVGYSNSKGIVTTSNEVVAPLELGVETSGKYIVHPAFTTDLSLGGWSSELSGIWVAKYEMSMETDGSATTTSSSSVGNVLTTENIKMVSKPDVSSWRNITIGNIYTNCYNYDRTNESHLMKDSEWGAVAYLSYSQYGTNGTEIAVNDSSSYITGTGGTAASSTGNETGVYDLSGGAWEYVATYDRLGGDNLNYGEDNNGNNFATGTSTKYATAYSNGNTQYCGKQLVRDVSKTGDGIREMVTGDMFTWNGDFSDCVDAECCFDKRGGSYYDGSDAGIFCAIASSGWSSYDNSFRAVLVPARLTW